MEACRPAYISATMGRCSAWLSWPAGEERASAQHTLTSLQQRKFHHPSLSFSALLHTSVHAQMSRSMIAAQLLVVLLAG